MKTKEERYSAQLAKYFAKVIINRGNNFYAKKHRQISFEQLIEEPSLTFVDPKIFDGGFQIPNVVIFNVKLYIESDELETALNKMNARERFFIVNKFIFGLIDEEIGQLLGISRQAVNNFKQRLYKRIKNK
uniref:hypothetical protein n=1 Tax=Candidatus Enterococcus willemsii TaxID=1857215 RepID=UPI00403F819D